MCVYAPLAWDADGTGRIDCRLGAVLCCDGRAVVFFCGGGGGDDVSWVVFLGWWFILHRSRYKCSGYTCNHNGLSMLYKDMKLGPYVEMGIYSDILMSETLFVSEGPGLGIAVPSNLSTCIFRSHGSVMNLKHSVQSSEKECITI